MENHSSRLFLLTLDPQNIDLDYYLPYFHGGGGVYFVCFGLKEAIDFLQSFKTETINSHKLPENIESVSKRICNFKAAAQRAQQAT